MNSRRAVETGESAAGVADADVGAALGYSRPGSYEELRAVLSSGTARLPKKLRQVAIHLWQHPTAVALGTVTSVADEAGVQPSTLVRFAQAFGYSGFSDLQEVFKAYLADGGRRTREEAHSHWDGDSRGEAARLVDGFVGSSANSLAHVRDRLDLAQFEIMSQTLAAADLIYIIGAKRAFSLVELCVARVRQSRRAQPCARQCRLDRVRALALRDRFRRGARHQLHALQFHHPGTGRFRRAARRSDRLADRQRLQSARSRFEGLCRGGRREVFRFKSLSATLAVAMALVLRVEQRRAEAESHAQGSPGNVAPGAARRRLRAGRGLMN